MKIEFERLELCNLCLITGYIAMNGDEDFTKWLHLHDKLKKQLEDYDRKVIEKRKKLEGNNES